MSNLRHLLAQCAETYDDLVDASLPGRGDPDERPAADPTRKPAPGSLSVIDHRHQLVRGLRWWVDAVRDPGEPTRLGGDVRAMCAYLAGHLEVMAPEDRAELAGNLSAWLNRAAAFMGEPTRPPQPLPLEALAPGVAPVRVADAAALLGCTVRTVQRRVPADQRPGGMVLLRDAWRCDLCDLPHGQCAHTST